MVLIILVVYHSKSECQIIQYLNVVYKQERNGFCDTLSMSSSEIKIKQKYCCEPVIAHDVIEIWRAQIMGERILTGARNMGS